MAPTLRLSLEPVDDAPAMETAVARALLQRVDAGELPATLRLARPARVVAFSSRDTRDPGFAAAVAVAAAHGFGSVVRLAGGRPAVFTPATIAFSLAEPDDLPRVGIERRFASMAQALAGAFQDLGLDARIGEVAGEYCPGAWSVNLGGTRKVAGIGQRLVRRAAHTGGVVVVDDAAAIAGVLTEVHAAMGIDWDPATTGQLRDAAPLSWDTVHDAIAARFARTHTIEPWSLDGPTLRLARRLAREHVPDVTGVVPRA